MNIHLDIQLKDVDICGDLLFLEKVYTQKEDCCTVLNDENRVL